MDTKELIGLINSVSTRSIFIVDYLKFDKTLQGDNIKVDLETGCCHVVISSCSGEYLLDESSIHSALQWCENNHNSGDWIIVPVVYDSLVQRRFPLSFRLVNTSQHDRYIVIVDDCLLYPSSYDMSFCVEYSSILKQYTVSHGGTVYKFCKPLLTYDEKSCLAAFLHGYDVSTTAKWMNCSSSKIKQLRMSLTEKFNVERLVEVVPINQLITFINL